MFEIVPAVGLIVDKWRPDESKEATIVGSRGELEIIEAKVWDVIKSILLDVSSVPGRSFI